MRVREALCLCRVGHNVRRGLLRKRLGRVRVELVHERRATAGTAQATGCRRDGRTLRLLWRLLLLLLSCLLMWWLR